MKKFSVVQVRELAVAAECDPRTIRKILAGEPGKGVVRERVERVLRERGVKFPGSGKG